MVANLNIMSASGSFSIRNFFGYVGALIGLNAIVIPAVPVLQYLVVRHVKAEGDRVRGGFKWLHGALFTLWVYASPLRCPPTRPTYSWTNTRALAPVSFK